MISGVARPERQMPSATTSEHPCLRGNFRGLVDTLICPLLPGHSGRCKNICDSFLASPNPNLRQCLGPCLAN